MASDTNEESKKTSSNGNLNLNTPLGSYRFLASVGKGMCAIVYKASCLHHKSKSSSTISPDLKEGDDVAIKIIFHSTKGMWQSSVKRSNDSLSLQSSSSGGKRRNNDDTSSTETLSPSSSKEGETKQKRKGSFAKRSKLGSFIGRITGSNHKMFRSTSSPDFERRDLDALKRGPEMDHEDPEKIQLKKNLKVRACEVAAYLMNECDKGAIRRPPPTPKTDMDSSDDMGLYEHLITSPHPQGFRIIRTHMLEVFGDPPPKAYARTRREIAIHEKLVHPNVVRLFDYKIDIEATNLVVEYCEETLFCFLKRARNNGMDLYETMILADKLGSALAYVHDMGCVHRDVKPENIMLKRCGDISTLKLCDFGLATNYFSWSKFPSSVSERRSRKMESLAKGTCSDGPLYVSSKSEESNSKFDAKMAEEFLETLWNQDKDFEDHYDGLLREYCGSPRYVAPEIVRKTPYRGPEIDDWSFGVVLAVSSTFHMLPMAKDTRQLFAFLLNDAPVFIPDYVNEVMQNAMSALLDKDPRYRATSRQISEWASTNLKVEPSRYKIFLSSDFH